MAKDYSHCKLIHRQAVHAAQQASEEKAVEVGDNWWPCGFAWVRVSPATQDFGRYLKKAGVVDGTAFGGGYQVWNPSGNSTQNMYIKEAGARAYADVLCRNNIKCTVESRMD